MKIAVLDDYASVALQIADWSSLNADVTAFHDTLTDEAELISRLKEFDVICMMRERTPFPARLINSLPKLKLLMTSGPRNLSIDLQAASANNVTVCGTQSRKTTTSELATLLMLSLSRNLIPEVQSMQASGWQTGLGRDLNGLSLGLIGLGNIGAQMAALGKIFGMTVGAWSPNLDASRCNELDVDYHSSLHSLMGASDVVSVHMVLSDRTHGLIDQKAFKCDAGKVPYLLIHQGDLSLMKLRCWPGLENGRPWKAGLDVYSEEPYP